MERIATYANGDVLPSADVDALQDRAAGIPQLKGTLVGCPYVSCTGTGGGNDLKIGGIHGVVLVGHENENDNSAGVESTYTPAGLANSTWYHLYAISSAGVLAFAHATHAAGAPDNSLVFRSVGASALDQRRLCSFYVNGSGQIVGFRKIGNLHLWDFSAMAATSFRALNNGHATSFTDVVLTTWMPPHARMVKIKAHFYGEFNFFRTGHIRTKGGTGDDHNFSVYGSSIDGAGPASLDVDIQTVDLLTDSSQTIQYTATAANAGMFIWVLGFYE